MPLSDIAQINITTTPGGPTRQGFGVPLILSHGAWTTSERTRSYSTLLAVASDFAASSPTYLAAQAVFSQNPAPSKVMVGRSTTKPTQVFKVEILSVGAGKYDVRVGSQVASFVATGSDTNDSIVAGLLSAVNALPGVTLTATSTGAGGSHVLVLTANSGDDAHWNGVEVLETTLMNLTETTASFTVANDLNAILNESGVWYELITYYNSAALIEGFAAWTEANGRMYAATSSDTHIINDADSGATDVAHALKGSSYARTFLLFHPANDAFAGAAWAGACLPDDPGSETWKFKKLAGVPVTTLTGTQQANLDAKFCNYYYQVAGLNITSEGIVSANEFIDVIRFRDWLTLNMQADVLQALTASKKIPMTDAGVTLVQGVIKGRLAQGVKQGGLAADPAPVVNVPKVADVPSGDRTARKLSGITFTATLAGAIHSISVQGSIST